MRVKYTSNTFPMLVFVFIEFLLPIGLFSISNSRIVSQNLRNYCNLMSEQDLQQEAAEV